MWIPALNDVHAMIPQVNYTANGLNINCGSWGSFAEEGMLGNNMEGIAFVERYSTRAS